MSLEPIAKRPANRVGDIDVRPRFLFWARVIVFVAGILAVAVTLLAVGFAYMILPPQIPDVAVDMIFEIPDGSSTTFIAAQLEEQGLIRSGYLFTILCRLSELDTVLKAGAYRLSRSMNLLEVLERLRAGRVMTCTITIPEGFSAKQIGERLQHYGVTTLDRFMSLVSNPRYVFDGYIPVPVPPGVSLEGYLFPDTYRFVVGGDPKQVIRVMVQRFMEKALPVLEKGSSRNQLTVHQGLTLASIIEKEAVVDRERPVISGVFHNRLQLGMPLQSDPTVLYLFDEGKKRLYLRDLEIDSPYNTYRNKGLPPGPISNPGLRSIRAAMNPARVEYLYFVARGDGTHTFSRTFAEHVQAKKRASY